MLASRAQGQGFERKRKVQIHKVTIERVKTQLTDKTRFKNLAHTFSPWTQKADAGRSLKFRPTWSSELSAYII